MGSIALPWSQRVARLQALTLAWMLVEAGVALTAAWRAHSAAMLAFGGDSVIELLSAAVVVLALANPGRQALAGRAGGWLLLALAPVVTVIAVLAWTAGAPRPSLLGIVLLLAAAAVMPWLGRQKRQLVNERESVALRADAAQSSVCGYLAWIALAGLVLNATLGWRWADPLAALALVPLIAVEGWKMTRHAEPCCS